MRSEVHVAASSESGSPESNHRGSDLFGRALASTRIIAASVLEKRSVAHPASNGLNERMIEQMMRGKSSEDQEKKEQERIKREDYRFLGEIRSPNIGLRSPRSLAGFLLNASGSSNVSQELHI